MPTTARKTRKKKERVLTEPLTVGHYRGSTFLLYREVEKEKPELFFLGSRTGKTFSGKPQKIKLRYSNKVSEDISQCRDFRFFGNNDDIILTYIRDREFGPSLCYAATKDRKNWIVGGEIEKINTPSVLVPELESGAGDTIYFGGDVLRTAVSKNVRNWSIVEPARVPYWHFFNGEPFRVAGALSTPLGIAVFYESEITIDIITDVNLRDEKVGEERFVKIGAAFFKESNPTELLWQTELPLIESPLKNNDSIRVFGIVPVSEKEDTFRFYVTSSEGEIGFFEFTQKMLLEHREQKIPALKKFSGNPILGPTKHEWESHGAFNPTALRAGGKIHLLYRAVGPEGSYIGYASSTDGLGIDERLPTPIYKPTFPFETPNEDTIDDRSSEIFHSGGSWGGCEDPKLTQIDERIYMTYVAHAGYWPMRTALTSILVEDFLKKRWRWTKPKLMSPPNVGSKSVVILPEKINNRYVIFHRIWPSIVIDTVSELEFGGEKGWLKTESVISPRRSYWDSQKLSMGAAPIKTDKGWLAIYNAVDRFDSSRYKIGAMLLKSDDPKVVLARTRKPILSPDEWYENDGKPGIAYPGGAVELNGTVHVYYGGADKVSCVATIPTDELLWHLLGESDARPTITPIRLS